MQNNLSMKELSDRIYKFLKDWAHIRPHWKEGDEVDEKYTSPDAYELLYAADMLKQGKHPVKCFSEWGSGGYGPYSAKHGRALHDALVKEVYQYINGDKRPNEYPQYANDVLMKGAEKLDTGVLCEAYHVLFGKDWNAEWDCKVKASEMLSIIQGHTGCNQRMRDWVRLIYFLTEKVIQDAEKMKRIYTEELKHGHRAFE